MASKRNWHWTFGAYCHISFQNGGDPVDMSPQAFVTDDGCATISDTSGNLLFYTDGRNLYNAAHVQINGSTSPLGGGPHSCHSAIIVPPAGGGARYHILAVGEWPANVGPLTYTAVSVSGSGAVSIPSGPAPLGFGPSQAAEKLAAVSHADCDKYWVISLNIDGTQPAVGTLHSMLIASDAGPTPVSSQPYPFTSTVAPKSCVKFSQDGTLLAITSLDTIDIVKFDRATGLIAAHSQITGLTGTKRPYGVEFSPNGLYLYFTSLPGSIRRHTMGASGSSTPVTSTVQIAMVSFPAQGASIGALELAPNGKIYGASVLHTPFEIGDPDNATATAAAVLFKPMATKAGGGNLVFPPNTFSMLGLPTFTRIPPDCDDQCSTLAAEINATLEDRAELHNSMATCKGEPPPPRQCQPLPIPEIRPQTYITWGNSKCDCIEGDDTEIMYLTVCNPYSNLTLSNLTVYELAVVDANGNPVPNLPDGTPSIQLVPIGPYCFDDIAPCTCVSREFVLRLRGAPGGKYEIRVEGICFDACFHGDTDACFGFEVCQD
ncbi:MAG: hypothetical protein QOD42_140 [Sphingomonadales bacterium]|jgi:hypothetical protein|nr:hypothetical protein [Sphingomonadales bacterium]